MAGIAYQKKKRMKTLPKEIFSIQGRDYYFDNRTGFMFQKNSSNSGKSGSDIIESVDFIPACQQLRIVKTGELINMTPQELGKTYEMHEKNARHIAHNV